MSTLRSRNPRETRKNYKGLRPRDLFYFRMLLPRYPCRSSEELRTVDGTLQDLGLPEIQNSQTEYERETRWVKEVKDTL